MNYKLFRLKTKRMPKTNNDGSFSQIVYYHSLMFFGDNWNRVIFLEAAHLDEC